MAERLHFHFTLWCIGEGNGNPLQCSWLENSRDGGAWWAAIYGVAQSWIRLKWLSSRSSSSKPRQHVKKQRHYFVHKGQSSLSYGLSSSHVWMWELDHKESWMLKYWAFELWCWSKHLRVPWTARRSNQSILKEISPEYSLEGLMLKLRLQYFGHLMRRADSVEKTLKLGKTEGRREGDDRGWDGWMTSPTQWTWVWAGSGNKWWTGKLGVLQSMVLQRVGHDWANELNWPDGGKKLWKKLCKKIRVC